jgi:hypothetical protein
MDSTTHRARITAPVPYLTASGRVHRIPIGPCMLEGVGDRRIDVVWGAQGQRSAALSIEDLKAARALGHLVLLD